MSTAENNRLQSALDDLLVGGSDAPKMLQRAKAELLVMQSYDVAEGNTKGKDPSRFDVSSLYELKTGRKIALRPANVRALKIGEGRISLRFTCLNSSELQALSLRLALRTKSDTSACSQREVRVKEESTTFGKMVMEASHSHQ